MSKPSSTYRLQLQPGFGFDDAVEQLGYLADLGVSHVYLSPIMQAAPGSTHGYDVVDHKRVNEELGGEAAFERFVTAAKVNNLGIILDIVPNHMAIPGRENSMWWDVLEHGTNSAFAEFFDIDWEGQTQRLKGQVLVPILGDHYAKVLESGDLRVETSSHGDVVVRYYENEFPIDEATMDETFDPDVINKDFDALDALLQRQHYRLAYWRVAKDALDYRRFFDINSLVALKMQRDEVFEEAHARVVQWVRDGVLDGVRVDHVDGLADPIAYLRKLREAIGPDAYLVVEKILESEERLPASWPVDGTTGYDILSYLNGVFVEPDGEAELTRVLAEFTGDSESFRSMVVEAKSFVVDSVLRSDIERLSQRFLSLSDYHREIRDYTRSQCFEVVRALCIAFPVYRTYVAPQSKQITRSDIEYITEAQRKALEVSPDVDPELLQFFVDVLTLKVTGTEEAELVKAFQQVTGAVMAKGVEDTSFYRAVKLTSLNEVGCDPAQFTIRPDDFHEMCAEVQRLWPRTMIATTTHDTKRSEDVRCRLNVLSMIADEWGRAVNSWAAMNERYRRPVDANRPQDDRWPTRHDEYLLYQTMVGAYPLSQERAVRYMQKASKEAKLTTSWTEPNEGYDDALESFIASVCSNTEFLKSLESFANRVSEAGQLVSLAAVALKLTMPGVPDIYQGTELWTLTLVDPDNRDPVDFDVRKKLLNEIDSSASKMFVTQTLLHLRSQMPESLDETSDYEPLWSTGDCAANVLGFRRGDVITVVPRLIADSQHDWRNTTIALPSGKWRNVFTNAQVEGAQCELRVLFEEFPVAVLAKVSDD